MRDSDIAEKLDEVARLIALLCRRTGPQEESLQDFVVELSHLGLQPARIAELSGTTPNYASVALARARKTKLATKSKSRTRPE